MLRKGPKRCVYSSDLSERKQAQDTDERSLSSSKIPMCSQAIAYALLLHRLHAECVSCQFEAKPA
jgi:hypothetical protein